MGNHIMKTTIEIADDLFERAQRLARKEKTTFRSLAEQGLRLVLKEKQGKAAKWKWKPLVVRGGGLTDEFKNASWDKIRDEIYRGHGA
jgi:predicted transcriptional regulator